jgi:hypothetical protein
MVGVCETESCHGKADPEVNEWDDNFDNEASIRVTICHRTCSEINPWVRITIDDDAWNGTAASGCGHMLQHDVGIEDCPGKANYDAWGGHNRDYLIKWHGTRNLLAAQYGWSDLTCNGGSGKCVPSSDAEKDYWFYWERACPSVRNGACCGTEELGACCGDPLPDDSQPLVEDILPPPTSGPTTPDYAPTPACIAMGAQCFKATSTEGINPWHTGCCDSDTHYCDAFDDDGVLNIWWATCKEIPPGYVMPPDPLGPISYIPLDTTGSSYDACPAMMNLGPLLSASTDFDGEFPLLGKYADLTNPFGRDDALGFFVKGNYISKLAAEIEGKIVVLGDFTVELNGVNSLVHAGVGSNIFPNDNQVVMEVGGDINFKRDEDTWVLSQTPGGGSVTYGGTLSETGNGKLNGKDLKALFSKQALDMEQYLALFDELAVKSAYWSTLQPNGIITPAVGGPSQNTILFEAVDDKCIPC